MDSKKLTIVVGTYNRSSDLKNCLDSLTNQDASIQNFEVFIVDNASTDDTKKVSETYVSRNVNFHYFLETNQGLSYTRNRGYQESNADYVAYLDDDARVGAGYVAKALEIIETKSPDIFAGPIYPFYLVQKPEWFKDEYEIRKHFNSSGWIDSKFNLSGSNMIFKREILIDSGGFDTQFGMTGNKTSTGEESDLVRRLEKQGKTLYYDLDLIVEHLVPEYKMNLLFFIVRRFSAGRDGYKIRKNLGQIEPKNFTDRQLLHRLEKGLSSVFERAEEEFTMYRGSIDAIPEEILIEKVFPDLYRLGEDFELLSDMGINNKRNISDKILDLNLRKLANFSKKLFKKNTQKS